MPDQGGQWTLLAWKFGRGGGEGRYVREWQKTNFDAEPGPEWMRLAAALGKDAQP